MLTLIVNLLEGTRIARPQDTENLYILSLTKKMGQEQSKQSTSKNR